MHSTKTPCHPRHANLAPAFLQNMREKLLSVRRQLGVRLEEYARFASAEREVLGDEIDRATLEHEREYVLSRMTADRSLLREVEDALGRLAEGTFGTCEGSGEPIDPRRLEARPWTRFSVSHVESLELEVRRPAG